METQNTIPKKIWTFWHSKKLPNFIEKCIKSWKIHNPDFEIIILNNENYQKYLPDLDKSQLKHIENIAHFSDIVRINILEKYGGIWSDASIICYSSYDWILKLQKKKQVEFIGYFINVQAILNPKFPVIENWFFACTTKSKMMKDWKNTLMESQNYSNKNDYIDYLKKHADLGNVSWPDYLWMHSALQKCLQNNKGKYKFEIFNVGDGPFKFAYENGWEGEKSINSLIKCNKEKNCKKKYRSFIKLTGVIREYINKNESKVEQLFPK